MIYDILEDKLTRAGFTPGETLFRHYMPAECQVGVMIRAPLSGIAVNPYITGWHRAELQLITRHHDPVEGMKMALAAGRVLRVESHEAYPASEERGQAHLTLFLPQTLPVQFPRLEGNGYEFSQHFDTAFGFTELDEAVQF
jgi:hypothetical protein